MANVDKESLQTLRCDVSERDVANADRAAALRREARKADRKPRLTLSALAVKIKRKRNEELPFGKFAKDHKLTAIGSGRDRAIQGESGFIFLHEHYACALQYSGTRADIHKVKALVDAGAVLIDTDRLVAYREIRVRDEEVLDDDGVTRIEGRFWNEFKYPVAEGEKNILAESLKARLILTLAFDPTDATQVEAVLKLIGIEKIKRPMTEVHAAALVKARTKAEETRAQKVAVQRPSNLPEREAVFA